MEQYIRLILNGVVPYEPPAGFYDEKNITEFISFSSHREKLIKNNIWPLMYGKWIKKLSSVIEGQKVLEVMSGTGLLARELYERDIDIIATDDMSWKKSDLDFFDVIEKDALVAVQEYGPECDVLLVSWPLYDDPIIENICEAWGKEKSIIIIGEFYGCTATENFWKKFKIEDTIDIISWPSINDNVYIGKYNK